LVWCHKTQYLLTDFNYTIIRELAQENQHPRLSRSSRKVSTRKERKKTNNCVNSGHYTFAPMYAMQPVRCTHFARTKFDNVTPPKKPGLTTKTGANRVIKEDVLKIDFSAKIDVRYFNI
jgi:hypothetical protein